MQISSFQGHMPEYVSGIQMQSQQLFVIFIQKIRIRSNHHRIHHPGNIKCLARSHSRQCTVRNLIGNGSHNGMTVPEQSQVRMNLIRNYQHIITAAKLPYPLQFLPGPYTPYRIVRITKNQQTYSSP